MQYSSDYVVVGAGAMGMAFCDEILSNTNDTITIIDERSMPGGHWQDSYPFIKLDQLPTEYGVNSIDLLGENVGEEADNTVSSRRASGRDVKEYFQDVMNKFLSTGRVRYLCDARFDWDNKVVVIGSDKVVHPVVAYKKMVNATWTQSEVPSRHQRPFIVTPEVCCIAPNDAPDSLAGRDNFFVVGSGKTAIDTLLWLLSELDDPDRIKWVMPSHSWLINRDFYRSKQRISAILGPYEAALSAQNLEELSCAMEQEKFWLRIDETVFPSAFRGAGVVEDDLIQLRKIKNRIELGRLKSVEKDFLILENGKHSLPPRSLIIDCTAAGVPKKLTLPSQIFEDDKIHLLLVRSHQANFSGAAIGKVASMDISDDEKNMLVAPIVMTGTVKGWAQQLKTEVQNQNRWYVNLEMRQWLNSARLNGFNANTADEFIIEKLNRFREISKVASDRLAELQ